MNYHFHIVIEAWPHQTGKGQQADQAEVEPRERHFNITASCMADAYRMACAIEMGIKSHSKVWETCMTSIVKDKP